MRFIVMVMGTKESEAGPPPKPEAFAAMQKYNEKAAKAGVLLAAEGSARPQRARASSSAAKSAPSSMVRSPRRRSSSRASRSSRSSR